MIKRALQFAVLAGCIYLLWRNVDWQEAAALLRTAELPWLAGAVVFLTLQTVLSSERWRITAAQLGISFSFRHALREYYLSQVVNQSLPGGVVGDAGRAIRAKDQAGIMASGQAVLFERLAGQLGLVSLLSTGLIFGLLTPTPQARPEWFTSLGVTLLSIVAFTGLAAFTIMRGFSRTNRPFHGVIAKFTHAVFGKTVWRQQSFLSLATASCNIVAFALCAKAIGAPMGFETAITLIPLVLFAMVVPLSIGGWGLREGAAAILFPVFGATSGQGLAASVAFGLAILMSIAPGICLAGAGRKHAHSLR